MESQNQILTPFQCKHLQKSKQQPDLRPDHRLRIEIMLLANAGQSQAQICKALGCCPKTVRYWIAMARAGEAHKWRQTGRSKTISEQYLDRLKELVSHSPREYGYSFERWTANWLGKHLAKELNIEISNRHINRLLKEMGLSTRPKCPATELSRPKASGITIHNLQPASLPDFSLFFTPIKASG